MTLSEDARTLWETATALARQAGAVSPSGVGLLPPLLFFTDPHRTPQPWETAQRLPAGSAVVYRHFGSAYALTTAKRLRDVTADSGCRLLIGQDVELAEAVGADGVHLPERDLGLSPTLAQRHPYWILTGAVHSLKSLQSVQGLSAAVLSPVFVAGGASASRPALGIERFAAWARLTPCPVFALGGIKADNVRELLKAGACGIAGVDAIQNAFRA